MNLDLDLLEYELLLEHEVKESVNDIKTETNDGSVSETERGAWGIIGSLEESVRTAVEDLEDDMNDVEVEIANALKNTKNLVDNLNADIRQLKNNFDRKIEVLKKKIQKVTMEVSPQTGEEFGVSNPKEKELAVKENQTEEGIEADNSASNESDELSELLECKNYQDSDSYLEDLKDFVLIEMSSESNCQTYRPFCFTYKTSGHKKNECGSNLTLAKIGFTRRGGKCGNF